MKKLISVCLPCYNERENVPIVCEDVIGVLETMPDYDYELIFEDNASTDGTRDVLKGIAAVNKNVKVIFNTRNFGPLRSGKNCLFAASGDVVISMATDLQTPASIIPELVRYWEDGYKIVMGQKEATEEGMISRSLRGLYYRIIGAFSEVRQYSQVTGFGAYDAAVVKIMRDQFDYDVSTRHILPELGFEVKFVPFKRVERKYGKSSYNFWRNFDFSITSLIHTSMVPLRVATLVGVVGSILSMLVALGYLVAKLINWSGFSAGMAPILIGVFFVGSVQLFFLGILGEYLASVLRKISKRPLVTEAGRLNFENPER
jgi:glycosyltransferase involved in cell wall biosynthesis